MNCHNLQSGSLLPCVGRSKLMQILQSEAANSSGLEPDGIGHLLAGNQRKGLTEQTDGTLVIIIDTVIIVQEIANNPVNIKTCKDLATQFVTAVDKRTAQYDAVHVIFDHYTAEASLEQGTRDLRKGENVTRNPLHAQIQLQFVHL